VRVVIADDAEYQRWMVIGMLRRLGHEVVASVGDGVAAIEAVKTHKPDVVILDQSMPFMTGDLAAIEIAKMEKPPRIVFATNQSYHSLEVLADSIGAVICRKPYKEARLAAFMGDG
jgi:CheY-like chemotaxis protein